MSMRKGIIILVLFLMLGSVAIVCVNNAYEDAKDMGRYEMTDEPLDGEGYDWELTYRLADGQDRYLYLDPAVGIFNMADVISYMAGNYSARIYCGGIELVIQSGTCYVDIDGKSFITNNFCLRELE